MDVDLKSSSNILGECASEPKLLWIDNSPEVLRPYYRREGLKVVLVELFNMQVRIPDLHLLLQSLRVKPFASEDFADF